MLCCYTDLHPAAAEALTRFAPGAELVDVSGSSYGYWQQIRSRWDGTQDLILVEQDIEVGPSTVGSMVGCGEPWCVHSYPVFEGATNLSTGLGCTKIGVAAQLAVPAALVAERFEPCVMCRGQGCWWHIDQVVAGLLAGAGLAPHVHGVVRHHHTYGGGLPPGVTVLEAAGPPRRRADPGSYRTDKVEHGYVPMYAGLADLIGPAGRVCEVGVWQGGSLEMWLDLFPAGVVCGVDVSPDAVWPPGTVRVVCGQDDPALPGLLLGHAAAFDLVVDDASHDGELTAATLGLLWPLVAPGGWYVIEDWQVALPGPWVAQFGTSMLGVVQGLLTRLTRGSDVESVTCRYGMAIVRKAGVQVAEQEPEPAEGQRYELTVEADGEVIPGPGPDEPREQQ